MEFLQHPQEIASHLDPPEYRPGNSRPAVGTVASKVPSTPMTWLIRDLIPRGALTMIVGEPSCGKSTFGAWAVANAARAAILPGYEESVGGPLLRRLQASGANLDRVLILDGRLWSLPHDRAQLMEALLSWHADLLWIDPIDSYVGECSENDGQGVRAALEAFSRVANDTRAAIVCARHPGKASWNLCPGSRQWRAVPRVIWQLSVHPGPPERRTIGLYKPGDIVQAAPRLYQLVSTAHGAARFELGEALDQREAVTLETTDRHERRILDQATELLQALLADGEQQSSWLYAQAEAERLGERALRRAAERVGVIIRREGVGRDHRSYWRLPEQTPPQNPDSGDSGRVTETPSPPADGGGVSESLGQSGPSAEKPRRTTPAKPKRSRRKKGQGGPPASARPHPSRETPLIDLVTAQKDISKTWIALTEAGLRTVGDLVDRAKATPKKISVGDDMVDGHATVFDVLHGVKGLPRAAALEIGDGVIDATSPPIVP